MIREGCLKTKWLNRMSNGLTRHLGAANGGAGSPQRFSPCNHTPIYGPNGGPVKQVHLFVAVLKISQGLLFH
jgi:hypothetical protein